RRVGRDRVLQELHARPSAHRGRSDGGHGTHLVRRRVRPASHVRGAHRAPGPHLLVGAGPGARAHRARARAGPRDRGAGHRDRPGRMSEPEAILAAAERLLLQRAPWQGKSVVVTAGPTREHLDPVRVVTNASSGRMGYALAEAAYARGAEVVLVSGPSDLPLPFGVMAHRVETTAEMQRAAQALVKRAAVLIMAAPPADYRPAKPGAAKRRRANGALTVEL